MRAAGKTDNLEKLLQEIEEYMIYDATIGSFTCIKKRRHGTKLPGEPMHSLHYKGYSTIYAGERNILTHHLVWLWHYGCFLSQQVDHKDRNKLNNRIENLREVNNAVNCRNAKKSKNNTSGFTGLKWYPRLGKWGVFVGKKYLGVFYNKELAVAARESYICNNPLLGYTMEHGV